MGLNIPGKVASAKTLGITGIDETSSAVTTPSSQSEQGKERTCGIDNMHVNI